MGISKESISIERVARAIHLLRRQRVMLDVDLAALYGVATKVFNQAVKHNPVSPTTSCFDLQKKRYQS
jgi:ORF6N domain-containing protein